MDRTHDCDQTSPWTAGQPRARGAKRRGGQVPNGLPRGPPAPVIPQLTVTAEEPDVPPASPGPPEPEGSWLPAVGSSHLQQPRRLSTSSLSSTGSSSLPEDSEDDLLSDSESRSRGNVQLEAGEDVGQVRAAGRGRSGAAAKSIQSCQTLCDPTDGSPPGFPSLGFSKQEHWSGLPFPSPMYESEKSK